MSDSNDRPAVMTRTMECVTAAVIFALGAIVIYDAKRLGFGWTEGGPESGYFPFRVGLILCISAAVIVVTALRDKALATESFVGRNALGMVMKVLIPAIVYVILIGLKNDTFGIESQAQYVLGFYVASFLFIAFFMAWIGKYSPLMILPVSIGVPFAFFLLFEVWFRIPLPKGLLEAQVGVL
jgi:putative tricarboxylic transport membrane protein